MQIKNPGRPKLTASRPGGSRKRMKPHPQATICSSRRLRRNTDQDIQSHHRSELAELDAQQAKLWTVVDKNEVSEKNLIAAINAMNRSVARSGKSVRHGGSNRNKVKYDTHQKDAGGEP